MWGKSHAIKEPWLGRKPYHPLTWWWLVDGLCVFLPHWTRRVGCFSNIHVCFFSNTYIHVYIYVCFYQYFFICIHHRFDDECTHFEMTHHTPHSLEDERNVPVGFRHLLCSIWLLAKTTMWYYVYVVHIIYIYTCVYHIHMYMYIYIYIYK